MIRKHELPYYDVKQEANKTDFSNTGQTIGTKMKLIKPDIFNPRILIILLLFLSAIAITILVLNLPSEFQLSKKIKFNEFFMPEAQNLKLNVQNPPPPIIEEVDRKKHVDVIDKPNKVPNRKKKIVKKRQKSHHE